MASLNIFGLAGEVQTTKESLKKLSVLLQESSSESDTENSVQQQTVSNKEETTANIFFSTFRNKYICKDAGYTARCKI